MGIREKADDLGTGEACISQIVIGQDHGAPEQGCSILVAVLAHEHAAAEVKSQGHAIGILPFARGKSGPALGISGEFDGAAIDCDSKRGSPVGLSNTEGEVGWLSKPNGQSGFTLPGKAGT